MMNKDLIIKVAMSLGMLTIVVVATLFIVNYEKPVNKIVADLELDLESDIVSTDPMVSATNFIKYNGTMGDLSAVNQEYFDDDTNDEKNSDRRGKAFERVKDAIIPDSPIISGREEETIKEQTGDFPIYYEVKDLKVGESSNVNRLTIEHDGIGPVEYESVEVNVDFTSSQSTFYWPTDASGDSIITQEQTTEHFEDVKVTLIKSGELWFIYDVEDIEYGLNARMSTWSGRGKDDVTIEQEKVAEYQINYNAPIEDEVEGNLDE